MPLTDAMISALTRMVVGITGESTESCEWYEGIEHDGAEEAQAVLKRISVEEDGPSDEQTERSSAGAGFWADVHKEQNGTDDD